MKTRNIPDWVSTWISPVPTVKIIEEGIRWLTTRSLSLKQVILRFPPAAAVRLLRSVGRKFPKGYYGVVTIYTKGCLIGVRLVRDGKEFIYKFSQEDLEIVGYHLGISPEYLADVFKEGKK